MTVDWRQDQSVKGTGTYSYMLNPAIAANTIINGTQRDETHIRSNVALANLYWDLVERNSRFVPYVGIWIAAALPIAVSVAIFPGWLHPAAALGLMALPVALSRGQYLSLFASGGRSVDTVVALSADTLENCVGKAATKAICKIRQEAVTVA